MQVRNFTPNLLVGLLFLGLAAIPTDVTLAQGKMGFGSHGFGKKHHGFGGIERLADKLELTEQQVSALKEDRLKREKEAIRLRADLQLARLELRQLMDDAKPDQNKVKQQVEKMGNLRTTMMLTRVQGQLKMKEVLSAEQLDKMKTLRRDGGKGHRGGEKGERFHRRRLGFDEGIDFEESEELGSVGPY